MMDDDQLYLVYTRYLHKPLADAIAVEVYGQDCGQDVRWEVYEHEALDPDEDFIYAALVCEGAEDAREILYRATGMDDGDWGGYMAEFIRSSTFMELVEWVRDGVVPEEVPNGY